MPRRPRRILPLLAALLVVLALWMLSGVTRDGGEEDLGDRAAPPRDGVVTGRILSASGDPPPPGTRVRARGSGGGSETLASPTGEFEIEPPEGDDVVIEVLAGPLEARVALGGFAGEIRLPSFFDAAGRVVEERSGDPVADAEVSCGGRRARTDERGRFRLERVLASDGVAPPLEVRSPDHEHLRWTPGPDAAWDDLFLRLLRR